MRIKNSAIGWGPWVPVGVWAVIAFTLTAVHVAVPDGNVGRYSYLAGTLGAGVVALLFLFRHERSRRRGLGLLAVGVLASGIGDALWELITATGGDPDGSIADVFYLAAYVFLIVAVLGRTTRSGRWRVLDGDGLIDLVSFTVIAMVLVAHVANIGAMLDDTSVSPALRIVWAAYPVLDAALLAVMLQALFGRRMRGRTGAFLLVGVVCWLFADFGNLLEEAALSRWFDAGWMIGACALAAAVGVPSGGQEVLDGPETPVGIGRILLSLVALLLPVGLEILDQARGRDSDAIGLGVATVVLVGCAYLRAARLMRARDAQQRRLAAREYYHRVLADNSSDAVVVLDEAGRTLDGSPQIAAMFGRPELRRPGAELLSVLPADQRPRFALDLERLWAKPGRRSEADVEVTGADGRQRWFHVRTVNLRDDPAIGGLVLNMYEVTARKRAELELAHQAFHDSLTGLPNRALFNERVEHALRGAARNGRSVAVIFLDVDGFKSANDRFGHGVGDRLLQEVGQRLTHALRDSDTVARLGGDEFAILLEGARLDEATTAADRALQALSEEFECAPGQHLELSASIGIAVAGPDATAAALLRDADIAMYRSKAAGKARWTLYDDAMRAAAVEQSELRADLAHAIERGELRLEYQPVVRLETEAIVGFEALARWDHPTRGAVPPAVFIPIAEASGAIIEIGDWVLTQATRLAARWQQLFPDVDPTMAVNLSARQIADPTLISRVALAIEQSGLDPRKLVLEMTESALVEDPDAAAVRLAALRRLGVRLAIDDFGTGYSSLSYLRQFPVDIIKIDRSFVNAITDRTQVPAIVRGLLDLGRTLQLETIAEGIEERDQLASLREEQCQFGQGYLFAVPLSPEHAEQLVGQLLLQPADA